MVDDLTHGARIDYLICDEAQFYTGPQIEQLAKIVDELQIDVFAFGILTDFRTQLFEGSQRLVELADRMNVLQVEALCWCGKRATHNARTLDGEMITEGEVIVVGDVESETPAEVAYEVLCRAHHRRRMTASRARAISMVAEPLPVRVRVQVSPVNRGYHGLLGRSNARKRQESPANRVLLHLSSPGSGCASPGR